jgi:hypothetical protein
MKVFIGIWAMLMFSLFCTVVGILGPIYIAICYGPWHGLAAFVLPVGAALIWSG